MSISRRFGKLRGAARRLIGNYGRVILLYHRVADLDSDPWGNCVSPQHFAEQMEVLDGLGVVRLDVLAGMLRRGELARRAVAITFDDGYADNLRNAQPVFERLGHPVTMFIATGSVDSPCELWWDELERLLLRPGELPPVLELAIGDRRRRWRLENAASYSPQTARKHRDWRAWRRPSGPRQAIYQALWRALFELADDTQRRRVLADLTAWAGASPACRDSHRCLSADELIALTRGGLIDLGAHSVTHAALPRLPVAQQRAEIFASRQRCEELAGRAVREFAFPFGRYNRTTVSLVREAGFTSACTTVADSVRRGTDPLRLPRVAVGDWDGDEFARRLFGA